MLRHAVVAREARGVVRGVCFAVSRVLRRIDAGRGEGW